MRRTLALLVLLAPVAVRAAPSPAATVVATPAAAPTPSLNDLLDRLTAADERLSDLYEQGSYTVSTRFEELDPDDGKVKGTTEIVTRMYRKDDRPWEQIIRFIDEGKDVTASRAAKREKELLAGKRKRADGMPFKSPFAKNERARYRFTDGGAAKNDPGCVLVHFEPIHDAKDVNYGDAIVDPIAGVVRRLEMRPAMLPKFVHKETVVMRFGARTEAGAALNDVVVDGEGGFLFVKKKVHVETKIDGYEMAPAAAAAAGAAPTR